jgi:hypothetical protein
MQLSLASRLSQQTELNAEVSFDEICPMLGGPLLPVVQY